MTKIGLALGGGGARGLAHVLALEALDELGLRPACLSGTSIGALIAVAYAAGRDGRDLRRTVRSAVGAEEERSVLSVARRLQWIGLLSVAWGGSGLVNVDRFLDAYMSYIGKTRFEDLPVPVRVVATDFWSREEVVIDSGSLRAAVHASMSLPGVFQPHVRDDRVLVDGGCVNPLPVDHLDPACDVTIAIDVLGSSTPGPRRDLPLPEAIFGTFQIMEAAIVREKLRRVPPTIYLAANVTDVGLLEFHRAVEILDGAAPLKDELKRRLEALLASR